MSAVLLRSVPAADHPAVWRGCELGASSAPVVASGWDALDAELPGAGWPTAALAEVLSPQPSTVEWRIVGPALRSVVAQKRQVVLIGPPKHPHLPGLLHEGLDQRHLVWIKAEAPADRLWVTEQVIKSNAAGVVMAWLPQARQEQLRRLQIHAQAGEGLCFIFRPESAQHESSAAPLRMHVRHGIDWELRVSILKRRGPTHDAVLSLPSVPGGLAAIITPRLARPSRLLPVRESFHVVGSPAPRSTAPVH